MQYLVQTEMNGYFCCRLVAALNACRWHGRDTIPATGYQWQHLVDLCGCRLDDAEVPRNIYGELGLRARPVPPTYVCVSRSIPCMIPIDIGEEHAHWCLVVGKKDGMLDIANYKGHLDPFTPVVQRRWDNLQLKRGEMAYALLDITDEHGISSGVPDEDGEHA
jgi:hypothetical protein